MEHFQADVQADDLNPSTHPHLSASADSAISISISAELWELDASSRSSANPAKAIAAIPGHWLRGVGDRLLTALSQLLSQLLPQSNQPQVQWWRDANGYGHYNVYDPISQETQVFDNAHQVRVWLEQRYYK